MKIATFIAGYLIVLFTLIPLIRNDNWVFRIFEYPRFQKLIISVAVLCLFIFQIDIDSTHDLVFTGVLTVNVFYLVYLIFPYTPIAKNQMLRAKPSRENSVSILICNVYQDNHSVDRLTAEIERNDPDMILLLEVNRFWSERLHSLHQRYPHRILKPLENTYGMSLYSKLELVDSQVKFLIEREVPSIHATVKLKGGEIFKLYGLHPEPPVPSENPRSTERDAEILSVAKEVKGSKVPVIVAGDLNDVAWSYTTELFMKVSGLLDPRRGRGFFSTFHVKYPLFRWPLDHVFCSKHFQLVSLRRLPDVGSDHFPMFISVRLVKERQEQQNAKKIPATKEDERVADEKIERAH